jgi:hypothetical protein
MDPPGDPGAPGLRGPEGPTGPRDLPRAPGAPGDLGHARVHLRTCRDCFVVMCHPGEVALGGGVDCQGATATGRNLVTHSFPSANSVAPGCEAPNPLCWAWNGGCADDLAHSATPDSVVALRVEF